MSVWVYKGEESALIEPQFLAGQLYAGWSVTRETNKELKTEEPLTITIDDLSALDPNRPNDLVRIKAKEAGIEGWENKRIGTLENLLNANENRQG